MKLRRKPVVITLAIFLAIAVTTTSSYLYEFIQDHKTLPPVASHTDITNQPMQTFSQSLATNRPSDNSKYSDSSCPKLSPTWVADENLQKGVAMTVENWKNLDLKSAQGSALWLNKSSGSCGDTVDIHASLYGSGAENFHPGTRSIEALRIGWYQGSGARQVWDSGPINLKERKINHPRDATRMVDTRWPTTIRLKLDQHWVPGFYLFITRSPEGIIENAAPFVIHSPLGSSKLMVMHSFITWNIYNSFGGRSGYFGAGATKPEQRSDRSRVISLDRPIVGSGGFSIHRDALSLVQFLEKAGINTDQYSDFDLDAWPSITKSYNGIVLGGHPEYFTRRIYDTLIAARNTGINIAILGGNTGIWQTRLADSKIGKSRRIVMYRFAAQDPVTDLNQVTIKFEDHRLNIPPTLLTGSLADGVHVYGTIKAVSIPKWLKVPANAAISGISPDSEVEHVVSTPASPPSVNILFSGAMHYRDAPTVGQKIRPVPVAQSIWFTTPSGAAIFNAGISTWSCDLIQTCAYSTVDEASRATMASVTTQILTLWQKKGVGKELV
jgi:hypothetical protein